MWLSLPPHSGDSIERRRAAEKLLRLISENPDGGESLFKAVRKTAEQEDSETWFYLVTLVK